MQDITRQKFNRLTGVKFSHKIGQKYYWLFKCDCGTEKVILKRTVCAPSGDVKSCGCLLKEKAAQRCIERSKTHGMSKTNFYGLWNTLKTRCTNPKAEKYKRYGARGIKCLWSCFEDFKNDMYESYLKHISEYGQNNTSIDRIDNDGNYCKENCKWSTYKEQANNKSLKYV